MQTVIKKAEEMFTLPDIGDKVEVNCQLVGIGRRIVGTVIYVHDTHRYYIVEFQSKRGSWRMALKAGGQDMKDRRPYPRQTYVRSFKKTKITQKVT